MSMSITAGISGMMTKFMSERDWRWGYPFALGLMVLIVTIEVSIFRRIGWL